MPLFFLSTALDGLCERFAAHANKDGAPMRAARVAQGEGCEGQLPPPGLVENLPVFDRFFTGYGGIPAPGTVFTGPGKIKYGLDGLAVRALPSRREPGEYPGIGAFFLYVYAQLQEFIALPGQ